MVLVVFVVVVGIVVCVWCVDVVVDGGIEFVVVVVG